jgi:hypothetical protein
MRVSQSVADRPFNPLLLKDVVGVAVLKELHQTD